MDETINLEHFMNRDKLYLNGEEHDLSHLDDCYWTLVQEATDSKPERNYIIKIIFSCHCFTKGREENDNSSLFYQEGSDKRTFCSIRYQQSHSLKSNIHSLQNGYVYINDGGKKSRKQNYLKIPTETGNYEIYFTLSKSSDDSADLNLYVQSAFFRTHGGARKLGKIRFTVAVFNTMNGKPVKAPPRHR